MSGDYTRFTFDPAKVFSGVLKQQGRVSLDADFNELGEILDRRDRSEMYDTVGQSVVPATTPDGFLIGVSAGGGLTIGIGRMYVDGLQAECFGDLGDPSAAVFDAALGGVVGGGPLAFDDQPFHYAPGFPGVPTGTTVHNLVYLDAWQREVTSWEDERLLDPALGGPDTATRVQTAWQVKVLDEVTADACTNPPTRWTNLIAPSTARMTAAASAAPPPLGPCVIQPAGGYTGLENRLYRVEVHTAGTLGGATPATFKWSRDNASLVASVVKIVPLGTGSVITVESTGRDTWMRFEVAHQVELLDDDVELAMRDTGTAGKVARITNVNHATGEITVDQNLSTFPITAARHPRIRRWDTALPADPAVRPVTNGTAIPLEEGISISFGDGTAAHDGDTLHAGDYWVFAARTADGSIETVDDAPPRGILHHFTPLAIVTSGTPPVVDDDCRNPWPAPCECEGGCGCDRCVTLESHESGALTIQQAVKDVIAAGGGTVCIGVGLFHLGDNWVEISDAVSVHVRGSGLATILEYGGAGGAIRISNAIDVEVRDLTLFTERFGDAAHDAIDVANAALVTLERLTVVEDPLALLEFLDKGSLSKPLGGAVGLGGFVLRAAVRDCILLGGAGVTARSWVSGDAKDYLVAAELAIERDLVFASTLGVALGTPAIPGAVILVDTTAIRSCSVYACEEAGIRLSGAVVAGQVVVEDNALGVLGRGIALSTDRTLVLDNQVASWATGRRQSGIEVARGDDDLVREVRIAGNRVEGFGLAGIALDASVADVTIAGNAVAACANGIVMTLDSEGDAVTVTGNDVEDIAPVEAGGEPVLGIALVNTTDGEVLDNTVRRIAIKDPAASWRAGIQAIGCRSSRIAGNTVTDVGPVDTDSISAGIASTLGFDRLDVLDNAVQPGDGAYLRWYALLIGGRDDPWTGLVAAVGKAWYWVNGGYLGKLGSRERPGDTAVRGNHLLAASRVSVAQVLTGASCTFSDNFCRQVLEGGDPVVALDLAVLALATNHVRQDSAHGGVAVEAQVVPAPGNPLPLAVTALGNITDGEIRVNGAALAPPWRTLNVRLS